MHLLNDTLRRIRPASDSARATARTHLEQLLMPHWALGRLQDLGIELAGITGSQTPSVRRKTIVVMAADHGVVAESVSPCPQDLTLKVVKNFLEERGAINILSRKVGARVYVVDMGMTGEESELNALSKTKGLRRFHLGFGTKNMVKESAMTRDEAIASLEAGIQVAKELADTTDLFGTGEMGIGNTTPSSAIISVITGISPEAATGAGSGLTESQRLAKARTIETAIRLHQPDPMDGVDVLAKVGGFEIGGMAGVMLGAAALKKPVLLDGVISTAAALIARQICPAAADAMIAAHKSVEKGHVAALQLLKKEPLLDLDFRLGEGTGCAMAMPILDGAAGMLTEMLTFADAEEPKY